MKKLRIAELRIAKLGIAELRIAELRIAKSQTPPAAVVLALALIICVSSAASLAQQPLDRTKVPSPGANPTLTVPAWTKPN